MSRKNKSGSFFEDAGQKQSTVFYIDGFNLYYGIKELNTPKFKWLDIQKLCEFILSQEKNALMTNIKYFTAIVKEENKINRQSNYLDAIKNQCECIEIIKGYFLPRKLKCNKCGDVRKKYEEKQTDVNIACHLMKDAYENNINTVIIISADSDLSTPINMIKEKGKRVVVWAPPKRHSEHLKSIATVYKQIYPNTIKKSLLPDTVTLKSGHIINRPKEWD